MTKCAETEFVPPAKGVIVSGDALPTGLLIDKIPLIRAVFTKHKPTI